MSQTPAPTNPATNPEPVPAPTPTNAANTLGVTGPTPGNNEQQPDWKAESRKWEDRSKRNKADLTKLQGQLDALKGAIAPALGLEQAPADPKQLADQLAATQAKAQATRREMAILKLATANGANPDLLTDSASFTASIAAIDPDDTAALTAAIKQALEAHPHFAATAPGQAAGAGWQDTNAGGTNPPEADANALRILGF